MKKKSSIILITLILISTLSCSKTNQEKLEIILNKKQLTNKTIEETGKLILESISMFSYTQNNYFLNSNGLYQIIKNNIIFKYPQEFSLNINTNKIKLFDFNKNFLIGYDESGLIFHDILKKESWEPKIEIPGKEISSLKIINENIIIYSNNELHQLSFKDENSIKIIDKKFTPPYKKYYKSNISNNKNLICLTTGIAGKYYSNIIDLNTKKEIVSNISATSSKNYIKENYLYYITGKDGNWSLQKFSIDTKKKTVISNLKQIYDLEFTSWGIIVENSTGLFMLDYNGFKTEIPFNYTLEGLCKNKIALSYNKKTYLINLEDLKRQLVYINNKKPNIFKKNKL